MVSEGKKWLTILWIGMLFAIMASPLTTRLTGTGLAKMGVRSGGWVSLAVNTIIFCLLLRVLMLLPCFSAEGFDYPSQKYWGLGVSGYNGPTGGDSVLRCNAAQIAAENAGCKTCSDAAATCMRHPFTKECEDARTKCLKDCPNKQVGMAVNAACNIEPVQPWLEQGGCGCGASPANGWNFRWWGGDSDNLQNTYQ